MLASAAQREAKLQQQVDNLLMQLGTARQHLDERVQELQVALDQVRYMGDNSTAFYPVGGRKPDLGTLTKHNPIPTPLRSPSQGSCWLRDVHSFVLQKNAISIYGHSIAVDIPGKDFCFVLMQSKQDATAQQEQIDQLQQQLGAALQLAAATEQQRLQQVLLASNLQASTAWLVWCMLCFARANAFLPGGF